MRAKYTGGFQPEGERCLLQQMIDNHTTNFGGSMSLTRLTGIWMIIVLALGCDSDRIDDLTEAAVMRACGPADGPAVAIILARSPVEVTDPAPPYVRIYIAESLETLAGRSWIVGGSGAEAGAWYHRTATDQESALAGQVSVVAVGADNSVEGWADITFANGRVQDGFQARFVATSVLCP
jgi:hypothetical protein